MVTDNNRLAVWRAFLQTYAVVLRALEREMKEEQHLPLTWYDVLAWLSRAPEGQLRMQTLSNSVVLSRSGITRLVDRMVSAGLVERQLCPDDRRGWYAVITAKGRDVFARAEPGHLRGIQEHFLSYLSDDDIKALHRTLSKVLEAEGSRFIQD
jgi:DNA-binding MarR family transcriptional regulator